MCRNEYDLFLAPDLNDRNGAGSTQWFHFGVTNVLPNVEYRFNIVNFVKKFALYATGRQPVMCCIEQLPNPVVPKHLLPPQRGAPPPPLPPGWHRVGADVSYYPSPYRNRVPVKRAAAPTGRRRVGVTGAPIPEPTPDEDEVPSKPCGAGLFCLTFTVRFPHAGKYRLASCYPYTYTDLQVGARGLGNRVATPPVIRLGTYRRMCA